MRNEMNSATYRLLGLLNCHMTSALILFHTLCVMNVLKNALLVLLFAYSDVPMPISDWLNPQVSSLLRKYERNRSAKLDV